MISDRSVPPPRAHSDTKDDSDVRQRNSFRLIAVCIITNDKRLSDDEVCTFRLSGLSYTMYNEMLRPLQINVMIASP